jgi:hypothetical protein
MGLGIGVRGRLHTQNLDLITGVTCVKQVTLCLKITLRADAGRAAGVDSPWRGLCCPADSLLIGEQAARSVGT